MNELERSRAWCANVMREHAKSFFFSTRMLPRGKRGAIEALYGLFRTADDYADEPGMDRAERERAFAAMLADVAAIRDQHYTSHAPWFAAAREAFTSFPIAIEDALALIRGCRSDLNPRTIDTVDELYRYSASVAGTVGRCSMPVLGACDADSLLRGERLGVAMQYTNVLRDVEEDRRMGRDYLPRASYPGLSTAQIMREVAWMARDYYAEARVLGRAGSQRRLARCAADDERYLRSDSRSSRTAGLRSAARSSVRPTHREAAPRRVRARAILRRFAEHQIDDEEERDRDGPSADVPPDEAALQFRAAPTCG